MKKVFSIFLSVLMLAAMFHFSIATHYCGGIEIASKVSLTGKLADCGMGNPKDDFSLSETVLSKLYCENNLAFCGVYANYIPSFSFIPQACQNNIQVFAVPANYLITPLPFPFSLCANTGPPGAVGSTDVDLSDICVFRI